MVDKESKEWRKLTFSQREGEAPLPEPLELGKLTKKFRRHAWKVVETSISNSQCDAIDETGWQHTGFDDSDHGKFWEKFSYSYYFDLLEEIHDEFTSEGVGDFRRIMRKIILEEEYDKVLTVLEHMLLSSLIPDDLSVSIKNVFEHTPYFVNDSTEPICIAPVASKEIKKAIKHSFGVLNKNKMIGAVEHLCKSAKRINEREFADSIKESIHAVESVARTIAPESKTLTLALDLLQKDGLLKHPALKNGFESLYGYTSDEQGLRHSLIDRKEADVDIDDAIFMFGACASFSSYLANKNRKRRKK